MKTVKHAKCLKIGVLLVAVCALFTALCLTASAAATDVPSAPRNVAGTYSYTSCALSWSSVYDFGRDYAFVDHYNIYQSTGGAYTKVGETKERTATIGNLKPDTIYYFRVTACYDAASKRESERSTDFANGRTLAIAAPANVVGTYNNTSCAVTWNAVANADHYNIYLSTGGAYKKVAETKKLSAYFGDLIPNCYYYYRITTCLDAKSTLESPLSSTFANGKTVTLPVTKLALSCTKLNMYPGDANKFGLTMTPANPSNRNVTWKSSNPAVVTVGADGSIKAGSVGTATITVTSVYGPSASCVITVKQDTRTVAVSSYKVGSNSIGVPVAYISFTNYRNSALIALDVVFTCRDAYGNVTTDWPTLYNGTFTGYLNSGVTIGAKQSSTINWTLYSNEKTYSLSNVYVKRAVWADGYKIGG